MQGGIGLDSGKAASCKESQGWRRHDRELS